MKKVLSCFFILFGLAALVFSTSKGISEWAQDMRTYPPYSDRWWAEPRGMWGDLANMAYLERVEKFCEPRDINLEKSADTAERNIDLYLYGDSYVFDVTRDVFCNLHDLRLLFRLGKHDVVLNRQKRNILIIEMAERFARTKYQTPEILDQITVHHSENYAKPTVADPRPQQKEPPPRGLSALFNPNINHNLEYHLFNYQFLKSTRELKATLNYKFFNRASGDVVISDNGNYLFYKPTVMSGNLASTVDVITPGELKTMLNSINELYTKFRAAGFDEVYFSIIPNSVSILQPQKYNQLIPLLQSNLEARIPVLNIYDTLRHYKSSMPLYRAGDSHWNNNGLKMWVSMVNNLLKAESRKAGAQRIEAGDKK